jgi:hypothetical protein
LNFSQTGPQGLTGATGATGTAGANGATGLTGADWFGAGATGLTTFYVVTGTYDPTQFAAFAFCRLDGSQIISGGYTTGNSVAPQTTQMQPADPLNGHTGEGWVVIWATDPGAVFVNALCLGPTP